MRILIPAAAAVMMLAGGATAPALAKNVKITPLVSRFEKLTRKQLAKQDVLVGSDICFWDELVKPLGQLASRALDAGVSRVIITDPGRPTFYELCDKLSKKHKVKLNEWYAVEPRYVTGEVVEIT